MVRRMITNWDDAYSNSAHIAGGSSWPDIWDQAATRFREKLEASDQMRLDIAYGKAPRQRLDLFLPEGKPRGLAVYIHGGYWMAPGPRTYSHLAAGALGHGFAIAIPGYRLCPEVHLHDIVQDVASAIARASAEVDGPIHLTGHSAGGHLVARMICVASPLAAPVRQRVRHVVSISGVHDLRPLLNTAMNATLHLDAEQARLESPALLAPVSGARVTCWVGGAERAEFRRQNALLANIWTGLGAETLAVEEPDRHHFNIIDGLADPKHPLTSMLLS